MKRINLIEQLQQKGFSKETLSVFTDKQLKQLHQRLCETTVTIDSTDKIKDVKQQIEPEDQIRVDTQEEDSNIGKFHKPVFKGEKKLKAKAKELDEKFNFFKKKEDSTTKKIQGGGQFGMNTPERQKQGEKLEKEKADKKKDIKENKKSCCPKCKCESYQLDEKTKMLQCDECGNKWAGKQLEEMAIGLIEKNYLSLTTKKEIMETLAAKMGGGPAIAPSKPTTKPSTKPAPAKTPGTKPNQNPYQSPRPLVKPHPKANANLDKNLTSLPEFLTFDEIFGNSPATAPVKEPKTKPAQPATRPGEKPKHNPYKSPRPLVKPHPKAGTRKMGNDIQEGVNASLKPNQDAKNRNKNVD